MKFSNFSCILFLSPIIILSNNVRAESSSDKKIERAVSSYHSELTKSLDKACNKDKQKSAVSLSRNCGKAVKKLDKRYSKLSDEIKQRDDVKSIYEKHVELSNLLPELEYQAELFKVEKSYRTNIEKMEKKSCNTETSQLLICQKAINFSDKHYNKIDLKYREEPGIVKLKERHEEMRVVLQKMQTDFDARQKAGMEQLRLKNEFSDIKRRYIWDNLRLGKDKKSSSPNVVQELQDSTDFFKSVDADCKGKFADIIATEDNKQICELAANHQTYINNMSVSSYNKYLDGEIEKIEQTVANLKNENFIKVHWYNLLTRDFAEYLENLKSTINPAFEEAGVELPKSKYDRISNLAENLPELLLTVAESNDFESRNAEYEVPSALVSLTEKRLEKIGMSYVKSGIYNSQWKIVKSEVGIPLRKENAGLTLMRDDKYDFCWARHTTYTQEYNGSGYEPASKVAFQLTLLPMMCD